MAISRAPSIASSSTETMTSEEQAARLVGIDSEEKGSMSGIRTPDFVDANYKDDVDEKQELLPQQAKKQVEDPKAKLRSAIAWMVVNTLATVGIVSRKGYHSTFTARSR
jgi:hypothetical protein